MVLAAMVGDNLSDSLLFFVPVSATSLYAVYRSNCAVLTRSLSAQRLELILDDFLSAVEARKSRGEVAEGGNTALLYAADTPSPHAVAQKEAFIRRQNSPFIVPLSINTDLTKVMHKIPADDDSRRLILREAFQQTNFIRPELYFLHIEDSEAGPVAHLWIEKRARSADVLRGLLHAAMVRRTCGLAARESKVADVPEHHRARLASTILFAHHVVDELYPALDGGLRAAGWNVDDLLVEERGGRLEREFIGKTLY